MKTITSKISSVLSTLAAAAMLSLGATGCIVEGSLDIDPVYVEPSIDQVVVDTGATMSAAPGTGVGMFVQYDEGGHWTVFTTCDTERSGLDCEFDILVTTVYPSDRIANVDGFELSSGDTFTQSADSVNLVTLTNFGMNGMFFDTDPGAEIEIDVLIDGVPQPQYVYAVSNGRLVEGVETNPVDFIPDTF
jgi:hypothetical protein